MYAYVEIIEIPCSGRIDTLHLIRAIEEGADGVFVVGCLYENCAYQVGNLRAKKRVEHAKKMLEEIGLRPERVEMFNVSLIMGSRFAKIAKEMTEKIRALGPNPIKGKIDTDAFNRRVISFRSQKIPN